jgi:hypothetical protein
MRKTILATIAALAMLAATTATANATTVLNLQDPVTGENCDESGTCEQQIDGTFTYGTYYDCAISAHVGPYWNRLGDYELQGQIDDPIVEDDDPGNGDDCLRAPCDTTPYAPGGYKLPWSLKLKYHAAVPQFSIPARIVASLGMCIQNGGGGQSNTTQITTLTAPDSGSWSYDSFGWLTGSPSTGEWDLQSEDDLAFALVENE